MLNQIYTKSP
jgi:hypothetical protein